MDSDDTVIISREEYEYLKRLEEAAQQELLHSLTRGFEDAAKGRLRKRWHVLFDEFFVGIEFFFYFVDCLLLCFLVTDRH